jgi:hypothetical protein
VSYALENALFQWEEGERRVRDDLRLERPMGAVLEELRRRLGSSFVVSELADFYAQGTDWAHDIAVTAGAAGDASWVVDAAFNRYAQEAANYSGGRARQRAQQRP